MRFALSLAVIFALSFLSGCADTHHIKRVSEARISDTHLSMFYVAVPKDGRYGSTNYTGSGMMVAHELGAAFSPYVKESIVADQYESKDTAMHTAVDAGYDYLVYPVIIHWEDRATEWSGKPDVTSIKVSVIEVSTGKTVDSVLIGGESKLMSWGGDRPEQLLAEPASDYAEKLFK